MFIWKNGKFKSKFAGQAQIWWAVDTSKNLDFRLKF